MRDERAGQGDGEAGLSVAMLPLPNFTLGPFAGFLDMLRLSADEGDRSRPRDCRWTIMASDLRPVRSSCGVAVVPWEALDAPERFTYVVVAGGLLPPRDRAMLDPATLAFLRRAQRKGVGLIGICTGSLALAEAGLLQPGSRCCVSWYHYQDMLERYPDIVPVADRLWLRDGQVTTCAGGTAAVDLAASLIEAHAGSSTVQKSLHIMLVEGPRTANAAQPQPANTVAVGDKRVRRAMLVMEQNLSAPLSARDLAARVSISKRQLERLFKRELGASLQVFGRDLRLSYAVWLMAQGGVRISAVAAECGFSDSAHFSRVFQAAFRCTPSCALRDGAEALQTMLTAWWPYGELHRIGSAHQAQPRDAAEPALPRAVTGADRRPYV